jgi:FKBP-type peptidyl-prolyl cis-trans isomerase
MKKLLILSLIIFVIAACGSNGSKETPDVEKMFSQKLSLENLKEKASYSLGFNYGKNLRTITSEIDLKIFIQGLVDGIGGDDKTQIEMPEMQKAMAEFRTAITAKQQTEKKALGEKNKVEGEKFLEENAKKEGIKITESGMQYKIIKEGTGVHPKATDFVIVHYKGTYIDGKEFDSSYSRGKPATFPLDKVIKGWTEALQLMKVGGKWMLYLPPAIAYGERGKGDIGPNATLIFEVEMLGIDKPGEKKQPAKK